MGGTRGDRYRGRGLSIFGHAKHDQLDLLHKMGEKLGVLLWHKAPLPRYWTFVLPFSQSLLKAGTPLQHHQQHFHQLFQIAVHVLEFPVNHRLHLCDPAHPRSTLANSLFGLTPIPCTRPLPPPPVLPVTSFTHRVAHQLGCLCSHHVTLVPYV